MERVLRRLVADGLEGDVVGENGQWWCGNERASWSTVRKLLTLCLIGEDGENHAEGFERYVLNEEGRRILADPTYVPMIVKSLKEAR